MLRRLRSVAAALGVRASGPTLVQVDRWTLAEELWSFGEDGLYERAVELSDDEIVQIWVRAGKLYMAEQARSAGEAAALAAVAVVEGKRRPLARKRRRPQARRPRFPQTREERADEIHRVEDSDSFPEKWC